MKSEGLSLNIHLFLEASEIGKEKWWLYSCVQIWALCLVNGPVSTCSGMV